jgi:hypothetical protein
MKIILTPLVFLFIIGCSKDEDITPIEKYSLTIDSVLTRNGNQSLPIDQNGYYHLKIITLGSSQSHRVIGKLLVNGKEPYPPQRVEWESNLYWWLRKGDTTAYITKSYVNYFTGQFTVVNLPPMIVSKDELVTTTNSISYSGKDGIINNMIAPIMDMAGDTLVLKAKHSISKQTIFTKIVLE